MFLVTFSCQYLQVYISANETKGTKVIGNSIVYHSPQIHIILSQLLYFLVVGIIIIEQGNVFCLKVTENIIKYNLYWSSFILLIIMFYIQSI